VEAREIDAPNGVTPLLWRLVTTLPVATCADAEDVVRLYRLRWRIEIDQSWRLSRISDWMFEKIPQSFHASVREFDGQRDKGKERDHYGTASLSGGSMRSVHGAEHASSAWRATIKVKNVSRLSRKISTRHSRQSKHQLVEEPSGHDRAAQAPTIWCRPVFATCRNDAQGVAQKDGKWLRPDVYRS
jgi:hypothetical protein